MTIVQKPGSAKHTHVGKAPDKYVRSSGAATPTTKQYADSLRNRYSAVRKPKDKEDKR
jgi:hypothetical protein